ncbi:hypothetical protein K7G81_13625 [Hephaestia sp. CMS5P-6]|nr:hypothetical protein [Hephaestia mangrovi]
MAGQVSIAGMRSVRNALIATAAPNADRPEVGSVRADLLHLEWILGTTATPTRTAAILLEEFGAFPAIFGAGNAQHLRVTRDLDAVRHLASFHRAATHLARGRIADRPLLNAWQPLIDYLRADLAQRQVECVRVLYLNTRHYLIKDQLMWTGTIDECSFHVRQVIARALELEAASMILVHNHPGGDPTPSRADIDVTRAIIQAGKPLGIAVHDHIIVSPVAHSSMRSAGLI